MNIENGGGSRITRDQLLVGIVRLLASRSTCKRADVGSLITKDNRVISTGYNGSPRGEKHCLEIGCLLDESGSCIRTVHAEANTIAYAARNGIATNGATLYTTLAPCYTCSKLIINAGIVKVVYLQKYHNPAGIDLLIKSGIECIYHGEDNG